MEHASAENASAENASAEHASAENASAENASAENASAENASAENPPTRSRNHAGPCGGMRWPTVHKSVCRKPTGCEDQRKLKATGKDIVNLQPIDHTELQKGLLRWAAA